MRSIIVFFVALSFAACGGSTTNGTKDSSDTNTVSSPTPAVAESVQTVTIDSPDGVKLVGSLYSAAKPHSAALLLLHQWQSDRHSYDDFAKRMQAKGFAVLSMDGRGFGDSTKKADGTTLTAGRTDADVKAMLGDVGAAFEFLATQPNVDPQKVGVVGASYGSSLALIYAADHPNVAAVALLSPGVNYFGNMPDEPAINKYGSRPLLMVAADDDKESADSVKKLKASTTSEKCEVQIYPKGGHGTGIFGAKVGLEDALEQFLIKSL